jgi:hypothetical protein
MSPTFDYRLNMNDISTLFREGMTATTVLFGHDLKMPGTFCHLAQIHASFANVVAMMNHLRCQPFKLLEFTTPDETTAFPLQENTARTKDPRDKHLATSNIKPAVILDTET